MGYSFFFKSGSCPVPVATVQEAARLTCYVCAGDGHSGEQCPHENRLHLAAERSGGDVRQAQREREAEFERMKDM